jgi:hypothetical protein
MWGWTNSGTDAATAVTNSNSRPNPTTDTNSNSKPNTTTDRRGNVQGPEY